MSAIAALIYVCAMAIYTAVIIALGCIAVLVSLIVIAVLTIWEWFAARKFKGGLT